MGLNDEHYLLPNDISWRPEFLDPCNPQASPVSPVDILIEQCDTKGMGNVIHSRGYNLTIIAVVVNTFNTINFRINPINTSCGDIN